MSRASSLKVIIFALQSGGYEGSDSRIFIFHIPYEIWLLPGRGGSRGGIGLIIFVHEILGYLRVRLKPHQKIAVLGNLALHYHDDVALLAVLIEKLVDLI